MSNTFAPETAADISRFNERLIADYEQRAKEARRNAPRAKLTEPLYRSLSAPSPDICDDLLQRHLRWLKSRFVPEFGDETSMTTVQLRGGTRGYRAGAKFITEDSGTWEQTSLLEALRYFFRPTAELHVDGETARLKLSKMSDWVDVKRVG
jgi:hypothetical protein